MPLADRLELTTTNEEQNSPPSTRSSTSSKKKNQRKNKKKGKEPGNCFCKTKKGGFVILCDACDRLCHPPCVGISQEILRALDDHSPYFCPLCVLKRFSNEDSAHKKNTDEARNIERLVKEFSSIRKDIDCVKEDICNISSQHTELRNS